MDFKMIKTIKETVKSLKKTLFYSFISFLVVDMMHAEYLAKTVIQKPNTVGI